ncbi:hypothetical protein OKW76_02735 [Sphingomonas sp. S1-29]|uniref:hypothetical protein n=1 Tax=Sphingomonas sp. S1-29 TaxID=2991074 RepID=UPI00223FF75D|nr:hypothetical protein [Sphingomonas sp. S1-29]UZK69992.1 hypothetical protein OKW76_02735 [Sphingomonas sp. S1-29]
MRIMPFFAAVATIALPGAAVAQTARQCVPQREAEALFLYMAPEVIRQTGQTCAANLPANALLRRQSGPFLAKFQTESAGAWPLARSAIARIAGADVRQILDSQFAQPVVAAMVAPLLIQQIRAQDCASIERVVALVEPLPARNAASLVTTILQLAGDNDAEARRRLPITICPAGATR